MRRGDIYIVDFEPSQGAEVDKRRPAIIVSNEGMNRRTAELEWGVVDVVPLSTRIDIVNDFQVLIPADEAGIDFDSKAQAEQVRAVSFGRLGPRIGRLTPPLIRAVDAALTRQLAL